MKKFFLSKTRCINILCCFIALLVFSPFAFAVDTTTQPLLHSSDITYIGSFKLPRPAFGSDSKSFDYGGMGLAVSADGSELYVGGHIYNQSLGRIAIPNPIGGTATLIQAPVSIPGSVGTGGSNTELAGVLVYNGRLIVQKRIPYDNNGTGPTHAVGNLNISGFSSFTRLANIPSAQFGSGYMGPIPLEWQTLLGGPAFTGNSAMSINSMCSNGPSFYVFNPDDVGVKSPVPTTPLMHFDYPNHMLADPESTNDLFSISDVYNAGIVFPSGTRSVLFFARHGSGDLTYKVDDGGCGGEGGWGADPYRRQVTAFDANDLLAVKNGTKQPNEIEPYAWWTLAGPSDSCGKFAYSGLAYDPKTRRIYAAFDYGTSPEIHVWQVSGTPADNPPEDTTPPKAELSYIKISGPNQMDESTSTIYTCEAIYSDGTSTTISPAWSESSSYASIKSSGLLSANDVDTDQNVTITASYQGKTETYTVSILDSTSSQEKPTSILAANTADLQNAVSQANNSGGNITIYLQNGTYTLNDTLNITAPGIKISSQSGDRTKVIIQGDKMASSASVQAIFNVFSSNFEVHDITLQRCGTHLIQIHGENNADNPKIVNCILRDAYEQLLKVTVDPNNTSVASDNGLVEGCLFEYTAGIGPQYYIGGIDAHSSKNWIVRGNSFKNIISPSVAVAEYAVHFWNHSADNTVENNTIINCDRGIGFGMENRGNTGGTIRNNMIYHDASSGQYADVAIALTESPDTQVYNNTIYMENDFPWAIEYRFSSTRNVSITNNLSNKLIKNRDNATGTVTSNITDAAYSWFQDVPNGNLHLVSPISQVIDNGLAVTELTIDFDGEKRPQGNGIDIGADEYLDASSNPSEPDQVPEIKSIKQID